METTWDLRSLAGWRGRGVLSSDGEHLGKLREIAYEYVSQLPLWLVIDPPGILPVRLLAPAQGATATRGQLQLAHLAGTIRDAPHADIGEGFDSLTDKRRLYQYFSIQLDESQDVRVLGEKDNLPGLERNW